MAARAIRRRRPAAALLAPLAALLLAAGSAAAQPVGGQILDRVSVTHAGVCYRVAVDFTVPVRYVSHFPYDSGDELRIQINPVVTGGVDPDALTGREWANPDHDKELPLTDVLYEGDIAGGPFLTLEFDRAVTYQVKQGGDFRSILIQIRPPGAAPDVPCPALDRPGK